MTMLVLDGSQGEGGGQILRSALALSLVTGTPFRIDNIRAGRPRPGLMRQHLTAVQAAAAVGRAEVDGAVIGSRSVFFRPGRAQAGDYTFSVGTAGSAMLVLQTVLPALVTAPAPSMLVLEGGTHNPASPPFDFLVRAYLPLLRRMGPEVHAELERPGFYPAGGGRVRVTITPAAKLAPLVLEQRGAIQGRRARAVVANLPRTIATRELARLSARLGWDARALAVEERTDAEGPGNVVLVEVVSEHVTEVFTGFGEKGVRAEAVADRAADEAAAYLAADVPVGVHLADQLALLLALAGGGSFCTLAPTEHTRTQLRVVAEFLGPIVRVAELAPDRWRIVAGPGGADHV
jgi:RNA 3'-terminal phosphate cyclase (ATP)